MDAYPALMNKPPFGFKIKKSFKDCLTRQIHEAISIYMSESELLNGKNEYLNNCIARVSVDEDAYEKKKREIKEEIEEQERLRRIESFKMEKSSNILGVKRKRISSFHQEQRTVQKLRTLEAVPSNPISIEVLNTSQANVPQPTQYMLAIQYYPSHPSPLKNTEIEPMLAIEYFAGLSDAHISDRSSTTTGLVACQEEVPDLQIVAGLPLVGRRISTRSQPPRKKKISRANN